MSIYDILIIMSEFESRVVTQQEAARYINKIPEKDRIVFHLPPVNDHENVLITDKNDVLCDTAFLLIFLGVNQKSLIDCYKEAVEDIAISRVLIDRVRPMDRDPLS